MDSRTHIQVQRSEQRSGPDTEGHYCFMVFEAMKSQEIIQAEGVGTVQGSTEMAFGRKEYGTDLRELKTVMAPDY